MALETWLIKVKTAFSNRFDSVRPSNNPKNKTTSFSSKKQKRVAVLAFEVAGVMSKLLHLWQSLSDASVVRLRNDAVLLEGVLKLVSDDESLLLKLAAAEFADSVRLAADSVSRLSNQCRDPTLRSFHRVFTEFADSGLDPHAWTLTTHKDIEAKHKKMERYVSLTATLHREIDELSLLESALRKALHNNNDSTERVCDLQNKIFWQKQEVKSLKERSLWNKGFDFVVLLLARFVFTVLARIKVVFGIGHRVPYFSRSLSASACSTVYPSDNQNPKFFVSGPLESSKLDDKKEDLGSGYPPLFVSGPLESSKLDEKNEDLGGGFFESNCKVLKPPPKGTLGDSALALHYANLIIVLEKMIRSPQLVGLDARDDLYAMLPNSIRSSLRSRLRGVGFSTACDDYVLAKEWRDALGRVLGWLSPLAHNMIKWQSERSFEQKQGCSSLVTTKNGNNNNNNNSVLLLQTLFFANKEKTEAAITELLVGLNYVWRFEREMTAKALFECTNFNNGLMLSLHNKPS